MNENEHERLDTGSLGEKDDPISTDILKPVFKDNITTKLDSQKVLTKLDPQEKASSNTDGVDKDTKGLINEQLGKLKCLNP
jgi:hypothetical protein